MVLKNIDWFDTRTEGEMFLDAATETKSVWILMVRVEKAIF